MLALLLLVGIWTGYYQINDECEYSQHKAPGSGPYYRIVRAGKWGFMNRAGETVAPPQFDDARDFFDGLAAVRAGDLWGYADATGRVIISPRFDGAWRFSERLAAVRVGRRWGFIDVAGQWRIRPAFQSVGEFHEGLARAIAWKEVECPGVAVFPVPLAPYSEPTFEGYPFCRWLPFSPREPVAGFIDSTGKWAIPAVYREVGDFHEGRGIARPSGSSGAGYIDHSGQMIVSTTLVETSPFSGGVASVNRQGEGWMLIDRHGFAITHAVYDHMQAVSEGLVTVAQRTEPCPALEPADSLAMLANLYTDLKRIVRLEPMPPSDCGPWRFGVIDTRGKTIIEPQFDDMSTFSDGVATVRKGNQTWNIDRTGRRLTLPAAELTYRDGLAIYEGNYIDKQGRVIARFAE